MSNINAKRLCVVIVLYDASLILTISYFMKIVMNKKWIRLIPIKAEHLDVVIAAYDVIQSAILYKYQKIDSELG